MFSSETFLKVFKNADLKWHLLPSDQLTWMEKLAISSCSDLSKTMGKTLGNEQGNVQDIEQDNGQDIGQ